MNIFKAIFEGWIRPRMELRAAEVVETAERIAGVKKEEAPAQPDSGETAP
jgi:hypothetical protein